MGNIIGWVIPQNLHCWNTAKIHTDGSHWLAVQ